MKIDGNSNVSVKFTLSSADPLFFIQDLLSNLIPLIYDPYVTLADKRRELTGFIEVCLSLK